VPAHACRIRVSMSAEHSAKQIDRVLAAFEQVASSPVSLRASAESIKALAGDD